MATAVNGDLGRQIGRLEGNMEALGERVGAVSDNLRELRQENAHDHGEVIRRLDGIGVRLDKKADIEVVGTHERRIDSLEQTRDREEGAVELSRKRERRASFYLAGFSSLFGAIIGVLTFLAATGSF